MCTEDMPELPHDLFVPLTEGQGFLYGLQCPACGGHVPAFDQVRVIQNGVATVIDRRGERVQAEATDDVPGAIVGLYCQCAAGHRFTVGFLQGYETIRILAALQVSGDIPPETLWMNPEGCP